MEALEEDIKNLKFEIDELKKDAKIKETRLAAFKLQRYEDAKLLAEISGKDVKETNVMKVVIDLVEENKHLKDIIEYMQESNSNSNLIAKKQNSEDFKNETYLCEKCDFEFDEDDALETHYELYHVDGSHVCAICDADFDKEDELERHKELNHKDEFKCNICDYVTTTRRSLNIHIGAKHKDGQC